MGEAPPAAATVAADAASTEECTQVKSCQAQCNAGCCHLQEETQWCACRKRTVLLVLLSRMQCKLSRVSTRSNRLCFCLSTAKYVKCVLTQCCVSQVVGMDEIDTDIGGSDKEDDVPVARKAKHSG